MSDTNLQAPSLHPLGRTKRGSPEVGGTEASPGLWGSHFASGGIKDRTGEKELRDDAFLIQTGRVVEAVDMRQGVE